MSKDPFTPAQRLYIWMTTIIVGGAVAVALGITYIVTRH